MIDVYLEQAAGGSGSKVLDRADVPVEETWDTSKIFASDEEWEQTFTEIKERLPEMSTYEGRLAESASVLADALKLSVELSVPLGKLYVYAHLNHDVDTADPGYNGLQSRAGALIAQASAVSAYIEPEIAAIDEEVLSRYMVELPELKEWEHYFEDIRRQSPHLLSQSEEKLLAEAGELMEQSETTYGILNNADLTFPVIKDENGADLEITHGRFGKLLESTDRRVREDAFKGMYSVYDQFQNTLATTLSGAVKAHNYLSRVRHFGSARERSLFNNAIPESVYDNLVSTVQNNIDALHDYVTLRKRLLSLDELHFYDLYVPLVKDVDKTYSTKEAEELILAALEPMGGEYRAILEEAFAERWIDFANNRGKRSGAYSSGTFGTDPYILMSWQGTLDDVFTLAHELGHSVHSYYSRNNQPYQYADYSIFLAEIASTTNENLLTQYLLKTEQDPKIQAFVINHYLDGVKGTVFRQTQFAEFEHLIHQADQDGTALTAEWLSDEYQTIHTRYYGPDLAEDPEIRLEWSRIPHFYYGYYVYQYATGFSAASAFSQAILEEGEPAVQRFITYLKSGSSAYPLETLLEAGLDMRTPAPIEAALNTFREYLGRFGELAGQME